MAPESQNEYAQIAMSWQGWASPVGLGLFVLCLAGAALMLRIAITGI